MKSFRIAQLAYDVTVRFCDTYINRRSRTHDQMVQAARSGVQNIAEGSQASGTSKKMELKLTNVARASLEELRLDYEDYLRQRTLPQLAPNHPAMARFKARRCATLLEVREWVGAEIKRAGNTANTDLHGPARTDMDNNPVPSVKSVQVRVSPEQPLSPDTLAANAALSLINLACFLLDRQVQRLAQDFEQHGGFTERLYTIRKGRRFSGG